MPRQPSLPSLTTRNRENPDGTTATAPHQPNRTPPAPRARNPLTQPHSFIHAVRRKVPSARFQSHCRTERGRITRLGACVRERFRASLCAHWRDGRTTVADPDVVSLLVGGRPRRRVPARGRRPHAIWGFPWRTLSAIL